MSICEFTQFIKENGFDYIVDAPMNEYTTFKIGGKADILIQPESVDQLVTVIKSAKEYGIPITFIGNGSNLLVLDGGIRGAVIKFGQNMSETVVDGDVITAQSGITMARLAAVAAENQLTGFEFASGIPGTLGGGIVMNAGAYKGELKDVVTEVTALLSDGTIRTFANSELNFSYRHSIFTDSDMLILSAKIKLTKGNAEDIKGYMAELAQKRRNSQPLEYPSAGSAFKRPQNGYAAAMIDTAGLKGYTVGGAQVSEKHAGFVINTGNATAKDVVRLLNDIREKVYAQHNTMLEPEIIVIGEEI